MSKIKDHIKKHKEAYIVRGVFLAGLTLYIMRDVVSQHIRGGISVPAQGGIPVLGESVAIQNVVSGKNNVLNSISYISSNRQGPPSWVIRCLETGDIFTSQKSAGIEMDLPFSEISKHLNGIMENVRGYHFERICMAA